MQILNHEDIEITAPEVPLAPLTLSRSSSYRLQYFSSATSLLLLSLDTIPLPLLQFNEFSPFLIHTSHASISGLQDTLARDIRPEAKTKFGFTRVLGERSSQEDVFKVGTLFDLTLLPFLPTYIPF
jgi:hypothetical protein